MTIGGSIGLIIVGAILAFAVQVELTGINIDTVGLILMIGGAIGLVFGLFRANQRRVESGPDTVVDDRDRR